MKAYYLLLSVGLLGTAAPATGADIVACVVAGLPNNANYFGNATINTKLKCEFTGNDYPTLLDLYRRGWRLIQVIGGDLALANRGNGGISPLYLLEREATPPPPSEDAHASEDAQKGGRNKK